MSDSFPRFTELPAELQRDIVHLAYLSQEHLGASGETMIGNITLAEPPGHQHLALVCRGWFSMFNDPQKRPLYKIPACLLAYGIGSYSDEDWHWPIAAPNKDLGGPFQCNRPDMIPPPPGMMCSCGASKPQCRQTADNVLVSIKAEITTQQPLMNHVAQLQVERFYLGFFSPRGRFCEIVDLLPNLRAIFIQTSSYVQEHPSGPRVGMCGHKTFHGQQDRALGLVEEGLAADVLPIIQH